MPLGITAVGAAAVHSLVSRLTQAAPCGLLPLTRLAEAGPFTKPVPRGSSSWDLIFVVRLTAADTSNCTMRN